MNMSHRYPLSTLLMLTSFTIYGMDDKTPPLTPEQVVLTIRESGNPALEPLKVELTVLGDHIHGKHQAEHKRKSDDDDATAGAAQLVLAAKTPFNTPVKNRSPKGKRGRPTPLQTHDSGIGIGNLDLSAVNTQPVNPIMPTPEFEGEITEIEQSIAKLEKLSRQLLKNENDLTEHEKKALEYINTTSQQAGSVNPRLVAAAALGGAAGALAWAAKINPFRIYKECCGDKKFTGLEGPALLTALKAVIGPVIALIGIGVLWYKFKQWVADPYKKETDDLRKELISHKRQMGEAIIVTQQQSEAIHLELKQTHAAIHKTINEQLARAEQVNRQQLELTLKTVAEQEEELKKKIIEFTQQATGNLATITDNVHDLQQNKEHMKEITTKLQSQQQEILQLVQKIKRGEEQLLQLLRTKPLVASSPQSAPVGGAGASAAVQRPQSAQEKQRWWKRKGSTPAVAPLSSPVLRPTGQDSLGALSALTQQRPSSALEKDGVEQTEQKRKAQTPPPSLALAHS
ncbi:MAG: hypothetical protein ACHQVS_00880 [Candidatus Babeliales bacterium]